MKTMKVNIFVKRILLVLLSIFLVFVCLFNGQATIARAAVDDDVVLAFETQNVYDDLTNSTIGGNVFNVEDYPHNTEGVPQIISLVEFCYSYYEDSQNDYGLYVYIYNPQDYAFDTSSTRNKIQMACGNLSYAKYSLTFLNYSTRAGYEGRFYKFKINFSDTQRGNILKAVDDTARVYQISGFELSRNKTVTEYTSAQKYTYSGYALGYGSELATESTLSCSVDGFDKYLELDVHHTVYRPQGDFYEGKQSQLNSCYFRVPERFFESYGELTKIACEWYEYITKPMLVTETDYIYQRLYSLHGNSVNNFTSAMYFMVYSLSNTDTSWFGKNSQGLGWASNYQEFDDSYTFMFVDGLNELWVNNLNSSDIRFDNFSTVFFADQDDGYENRYVTSSEVQEQLLSNSEVLGEPYLTERYSEDLFMEYVNGDHIRGYNYKEIKKDDLFDVFWNTTTKNVWQTIFGGYDIETIYDSVNAIVTVSDSDLTGSDEEIAKRLYVSKGDVDNIKSEYNKAKTNGERLVLFRFGESDYYSIPVVETYCSQSTENADEVLVRDILQKWYAGTYTGYIAQETVYLDFDIISLWFTANGVETEIPVVSSPIDVISGLEPPEEEDYHNETEKNILKIIFAVVALILIVFVLQVTGILPLVLKGIVFLITLPFKAIGALFKGKRNSKNKNKKE